MESAVHSIYRFEQMKGLTFTIVEEIILFHGPNHDSAKAFLIHEPHNLLDVLRGVEGHPLVALEGVGGGEGIFHDGVVVL